MQVSNGLKYGDSEPQTFPVLKQPELLAMLSALGVPCKKDDITKPTLARLWPIYEFFMDQLLGTQEQEEPLERNFAIMEVLEHPGLHAESLNVMVFFRKVSKFFSDIGIEGFGFQDFLNPRKARVEYILSGLINFAKYRQCRLRLFAQCTLQGEEYIEERDALEAKKKTLSDRVNALRAQRAEEEPAVKECRQETLELGAENRELKKTLSKLTNENESLGKHENELSEKLNNTQLLLNNLKQDCTRLSSKIVRNPEKLKQAIADMHKSLKEDKATVSLSEKKSRELHSKIQMMTLVEEDIKTCRELMDVCQSSKEKAAKALKKLENEKDNLEAKKSEQRELDIREQQLQRQLQNSTEKLNRLSQHQQSKHTLNQSKLDSLKKEYEGVTEARSVAQKKADDHEKMSLEIEKKMLDLNNRMESEVSALSGDYDHLKSTLESYQMTLEKSMDRYMF